MTTVVIFKSKDSYRGFTCIGHAGYSSAGSDIVCAAISVLVINTLNAIEALADEAMDVSTEDGIIECQFLNEVNDRTSLLMKAMEMGLKEIEKNYGTQRKAFLRLFKKEKKCFELIIKEV